MCSGSDLSCREDLSERFNCSVDNLALSAPNYPYIQGTVKCGHGKLLDLCGEPLALRERRRGYDAVPHCPRRPLRDAPEERRRPRIECAGACRSLPVLSRAPRGTRIRRDSESRVVNRVPRKTLNVARAHAVRVVRSDPNSRCEPPRPCTAHPVPAPSASAPLRNPARRERTADTGEDSSRIGRRSRSR